MGKIAIISDIHGNLEALKATLNDISKRNVDKIICLGDIIAKGSHPIECIELIRKNCYVVLQGNCDIHFSKDHDLDNIDKIEKGRIIWNQSLINKEAREYLINLPFSYEMYISGSLVRFFHASPTANNATIINLNSVDTKYDMFLPSEKTISDKVADIVIYGHIHHPYLDKIYNKTIINIGSVGNSFDVIRNDERDSSVKETTVSNYLIIEGFLDKKNYEDSISFQFIKVPYDIEKELEDVEEIFEKESYMYELKHGKYRDMKRINDNFKKIGVKFK